MPLRQVQCPLLFREEGDSNIEIEDRKTRRKAERKNNDKGWSMTAGTEGKYITAGYTNSITKTQKRKNV